MKYAIAAGIVVVVIIVSILGGNYYFSGAQHVTLKNLSQLEGHWPTPFMGFKRWVKSIGSSEKKWGYIQSEDMQRIIQLNMDFRKANPEICDDLPEAKGKVNCYKAVVAAMSAKAPLTIWGQRLTSVGFLNFIDATVSTANFAENKEFADLLISNLELSQSARLTPTQYFSDPSMAQLPFVKTDSSIALVYQNKLVGKISEYLKALATQLESPATLPSEYKNFFAMAARFEKAGLQVADANRTEGNAKVQMLTYLKLCVANPTDCRYVPVGLPLNGESLSYAPMYKVACSKGSAEGCAFLKLALPSTPVAPVVSRNHPSQNYKAPAAKPAAKKSVVRPTPTPARRK